MYEIFHEIYIFFFILLEIFLYSFTSNDVTIFLAAINDEFLNLLRHLVRLTSALQFANHKVFIFISHVPYITAAVHISVKLSAIVVIRRMI